MLTDDFAFELPADSIAQQPAERGTSRLLVLQGSAGERHRSVADLPELLSPGDLLVVNDTRVIPARLFGRRRSGGGKVELLLVEKHGSREWDALLRPGRRSRPGTVIELAPGLEAEILAKSEDGRYRIRFSNEVEPRLEELGHVPLPPYIRRPDDAADHDQYQTVFASNPGAIAAPTAGLHFTPKLLNTLGQAGVGLAKVTLHVGIGTFKPVTARLVHEHAMEEERWQIPAATATAIAETRQRGGRIVAVGTTVVRTLESAAGPTGEIVAGEGRTRLFITPGYEFQVIDRLLTNFHLPRSTLLMLVSALAGRQVVLDGYREAVAAGYRFYSYGDAMLVDRAN